MMLDLAPLSTQQNQLTDALNATFLTYNGNEGILQNDMGNTRIQDANTGNIMGLREGFVPIGMKEHGGVLYIASVNNKGEGEIGTIPSPIIRDFLKDKQRITYPQGVEISTNSGTGDQFYRISEKLYPGEKFLMSLQVEVNEKNAYLANESINAFWRDRFKREQKIKISYPYITNRSDSAENKWGTNQDSLKLWSGVYDLYLYTQNRSGTIQSPDSLLSAQKIKEKGGFEKSSLCWFLNDFKLGDLTNDKLSYTKEEKAEFNNQISAGKVLGYNGDWYNPDLRTMTKDLLKSYPSNQQAGYLCTKAVLYSRFIKEFGILKRQGGMKVPFTVKKYWNEKDYNNFSYYTYFPGFWYTSENAAYIKEFTVSVFNETDSSQMPIYYTLIDGTSIQEKSAINRTFTIQNYEGLKSASVKIKGEVMSKTSSLQHQIEYTGDKNLVTYIITYNNIQTAQDEVPNTNSGITDHVTITESKETGKKRSKLIITKPTITKPVTSRPTHGGIFYIKFDKDYNKNCILNISFKNQYGENIGTYRLKFNPYLNDTFGTNDMPDLQYADEIPMSYSQKILPTPTFKRKIQTRTGYTEESQTASIKKDSLGKRFSQIQVSEPIFTISPNNGNSNQGIVSTDSTLGNYWQGWLSSLCKYSPRSKFEGYYLKNRDSDLGYSDYYYTIYTPPKFQISQYRALANVKFFWMFNTGLGTENRDSWTTNNQTITSPLSVLYTGLSGENLCNKTEVYTEKIQLFCNKTNILDKITGDEFIVFDSSNSDLSKWTVQFKNHTYQAHDYNLLYFNSADSAPQEVSVTNFEIQTIILPLTCTCPNINVTYSKAFPAVSGEVRDYFNFSMLEQEITPQVKIIPYVEHKVILEGDTEPIKAGKLWTDSNFQKTTELSYVDSKEGTEPEKQINSWDPKIITDESIEMKTSERGIYILLVYGNPREHRNTVTISGNSYDIEKAGNFNYMPIVFYSEGTTAIKIQNDYNNNDLISRINLYKVTTPVESIKHPMTLAEFNQTHKDKEIILPLVSSYRECFYDSVANTDIKFKMYKTEFDDAIYPAPEGSISFTIDKDGETCKDWYYQASDKYDVSNSANLNNSSVRAYPGTEAGDFNNASLSKEKFKTFWKKQAEPGMSYKSSDAAQSSISINQSDNQQWKL